MSKNLTFKDTINGVNGIFVHLTNVNDEPLDYEWISELMDEWKVPNTVKAWRCRQVLKGPAIDRLYKFEQLGMEPEEIEELIRKFNALKDQIINKNVEINTLKGQIDELEEKDEEIKKLKAEIEDDTRIFKLKNDVIFKEIEKNANLREEIRVVKDRLVDANKGLEHKNKTIDKLREELDKANKYIKELEDTCWVAVCKKQEAQIDELEEENLKLKDENRLMTLRNSTIYVQNLNAETEISKLKEELKQKSLFITATPNPYFTFGVDLHECKEIRKLVDENEKLKTKLKKAQDHIVHWKQVAESNRLILSRDLSSFAVRNEDLMKMNDELVEKNKHLGDQLDALRRMHSIYTSTIYGAHPDQVENMKDQIERLNKNNAERQKKIDDLTIRLYAARRANDILRGERNKLKAENEKLVNDLRKNLETENKDLKAKLETINNLSDLGQPHPDDISKLFP